MHAHHLARVPNYGEGYKQSNLPFGSVIDFKGFLPYIGMATLFI